MKNPFASHKEDTEEIARPGEEYAPPPAILGLRVSAIIETLLFLGIAVLSSHIFSDGTRYIDAAPHPFWVIVILVTVQYGVNEGIVCALLSSAFLLVGNLPAQGLSEDTYTYIFRLTKDPLMWFISAVILGQLRNRQLNERKILREKVEELRDRDEVITRAYYDVKELKEDLEKRLAAQLRSSITAYNAIQSVEHLSQSRLLLEVGDVINSVMSPKKFSVYAFGMTGFESVICAGWGEEEKYSRRFSMDSELYLSIAGGRRTLCIVNTDDAKLLGNEGIMVAPLIDKIHNVIFGMLKIEEMDFTELTLNNIRTFEVICDWIGMAYANAGKYQQVKDMSLRNIENDFYSFSFFNEQKRLFITLAENKLLRTTAVSVRIRLPKDRNSDDRPIRNYVENTFSDHVYAVMPQGVMLFNGKHLGKYLHILLPGIAIEDVLPLVDGLKGKLHNHNDSTIRLTDFKFTTRDIREA